MTPSPIRAVIGVSYLTPPGASLVTYYVKRSMRMENYPGVWSLPSIQHEAGELHDPCDLRAAQKIFTRMSHERFYDAPIAVLGHLVAGSSDENPLGRMVHLNLYRVGFLEEPMLNPRYYANSAWLVGEEFTQKTMFSPLPCGLCTKLWQQHQGRLGI